MKKARSRLSASFEKPSPQKATKVLDLHPTKSLKQHSRHKTKHALISQYLNHLSTLIFAIPFYLAVYYIFKNVPPELIKNILLINSYFPLQLVLFIGNFFFFSFLTLKTRRGLFIAMMIAAFLFLKLQKVIISWQIVVSILCFFVIIEIVCKLLAKNSPKKNDNKS